MPRYFRPVRSSLPSRTKPCIAPLLTDTDSREKGQNLHVYVSIRIYTLFEYKTEDNLKVFQEFLQCGRSDKPQGMNQRGKGTTARRGCQFQCARAALIPCVCSQGQHHRDSCQCVLEIQQGCIQEAWTRCTVQYRRESRVSPPSLYTSVGSIWHRISILAQNVYMKLNN